VNDSIILVILELKQALKTYENYELILSSVQKAEIGELDDIDPLGG